MNDYKVTVGDNGLFPTLLGVLFIGLKLGGIIDWDWIAVLAPVWGSWIIALVTLLAVKIYNHIYFKKHRPFY